MTTTTNIYILKLENNKYYIGKTDNLEKRKKAHMNGTACSWTKKYKLLSVEKIIQDASPFDEDKYTIEYMNKYGIDNVRGGIYVSEVLDEFQIYTIKKSIWGANDCCTQCGRKGHFIKNCKAIKDIDNEDIYDDSIQIWQCNYCTKQYEKKLDCEKHEQICKNKEEIFNCRYCDKEFETQKGATYHENIYCKSKSNFKSKSKSKSKSEKNNCYRCGRSGHYSNECYAKTDINGDELDSD
jgi:hypothetical protein